MQQTQIRSILSDWGVTEEATVLRILDYLESRILNGVKDKFVSPLFPKDKIETVVFDFYRRMVELEPDWLRPFSYSELEKFQPRSDIPPYQDWADDFKSKLNKPRPFDVDQEVRSKAIDSVVSLFKGIGKLRSCGMDTVLTVVRRNTNSGVYGFKRRSGILDDQRQLRSLLDEVSKWDRDLKARGMYVIGTRAKESPIGTRTRARPIFLSSIVDTIAGLRVQIPLIKMLKQVNTFPSATGPLLDNLRTSEFLKSSSGEILSGDISNFDLSVSEPKMREALIMLKKLFLPQDHELLERVFDSCNKGRVLLPDGEIDLSYQIASGWVLTNAVDSLINLVDITYNCMMLGFNPFDGTTPGIIVNGDDFVTHLRGRDIAKYSDISSQHGMEVHPEKQIISERVVIFNQRYSGIDNPDVAIRSVGRHARSTVFPESIAKVGEEGQALIAIAKLSLMETNPCFESVLKQESAWDERLGLGNNRKDLLKRIMSKDVQEKVSDYLGVDRKDIVLQPSIKGLSSSKTLQRLRAGV